MVAGVEDEGASPAVLGVRSEAGEKFRFGAREQWQKQRAILLAEGGIDPVHEGVDVDVGRHGADDRGDDFCGHLTAGFAVRQWWESAFGSGAVDDGSEVVGGNDGVLKSIEGAFGKYGLFDDGHDVLGLSKIVPERKYDFTLPLSRLSIATLSLLHRYFSIGCQMSVVVIFFFVIMCNSLFC